MKILIYLGHPAQYHFFKNIVNELTKRHKIRYLIKTKEILEPLLIGDKVAYKNILPEGRKSTRSGIIWGLIKREIKVLGEAVRFKPDLMIGGDPAITHVGKVLGIPAFIVSEDDTAVIAGLAKITYPFATNIIAPISCNCGAWNHKKIGYAGYMKLAYLHPNHFKHTLGYPEPIILIRTSKLDAYHDSGVMGLNENILTQLIEKVSDKYTVYISSENELKSEFKKYALNINPNEFHNLLTKITLLISDSQSMSMEAAMLGIPSIRYSDFSGRIGVLEELEKKYGLTYGIKPGHPDQLFLKVSELLNIPDLALEFQKRRKKMLNEKIDVTAFMIWLIENFPESAENIRKEPDFQYLFR